MTRKSYKEMLELPTFAERLDYLRIPAKVGEATFGDSRFLNQILYSSKEWKDLRKYVISRDMGCDLAHEDFPLYNRIYIHHINPLTVDEVYNRSSMIFDLDNLVCVSFDTHQMIHYGIGSDKLKTPTVRSQNDTCPWK